MIIRKTLVTLWLVFTILSSQARKPDKEIDSLKGLQQKTASEVFSPHATEAEFLVPENTARLSARNEIIALKEEIIDHQRTLGKITVLLFLIFVGFVIVLFRSYRQSKDIDALLEKKIKERTRELELSRDNTVKAFQEKDLLLCHTSQEVGETARSIKGLCFLATKEVSDPVAHSYFERIHTASAHLFHFVQPGIARAYSLHSLKNCSMIKYSLFIALGMCLLANDIHSQDQKVIDSLNAVLAGKAGGERFPALYELTFQYVHNDNEAALKYIGLAEESALLSGDSLRIVKSKRVKAHLLFFLGNVHEASRILSEILPTAVRNDLKQEQVTIGTLLGRLHLFCGRYDKALSLFFSSLELSKQMSDTVNTAISLHDIGLVHYKLKDYRKALDYYDKSYNLYQYFQGNDFILLANIGLCYAYLKDFSNARKYIQKSLVDCASDCSDRHLTNVEYALGLIALGEGNFVRAEAHFVTSYSLASKIEDQRFQLDNICLLAEIFIEQKVFQKAQDYLLRGEKIIDNNTPFNLEIIKVYSRFSELYLAIRNYKQASYYQRKYIELKDSIYNEELTTNLMDIEAGFLERENEAKIQAQEEVILLKEEIIRRQGILNVVSFLLGLVFLVLLVFLLRNYRHKRDLNLLLEKRIEERTLELETSCDTLLKVIREKDLRISRASEGIMRSMNTISGLCAAGSLEISDPLGRLYMTKLTNTFGQIGIQFRALIEG